MALNGSPTLVAQMRGMRDVVRFLSDFSSPIRGAMNRLPGVMGEQFVVHGATLARVLTHYTPELFGRGPIKVLMVSDRGPQLFDGGRWSQVASLLTGATLDISVVVLSEREKAGEPTNSGEFLTALPGCRFLKIGPDQILSTLERPDVVFLPSPSVPDDVEDPAKWAWLAEVLAEDIPVVGWAYDVLDRDVTLEFFDALGYAKADSAESPLFIEDRPHPAIANSFGRYLFRLTKPDAEALEVDEDRMRTLVYAMRHLQRALNADKATPWAGTVLKSVQFGRLLIGLSGNAVHLDTGVIFDVEVGRRGDPMVRETDRKAYEWEGPVADDEIKGWSRLDLAVYAEQMCAQRLFEGIEEILEPNSMRESLQTLMQGSGIDPQMLDNLANMLTGTGGDEAGMPLFLAVNDDDAEEICNLVKEDGLDPNEYDETGWGPIHHAAAYDRVQALDALLKVGANVNLPHCLNAMSPLDMAMQRGSSKAALVLLKAGANIDHKPHMGPIARPLLDAGHGSAELQAWYRSQPR